MAEKKVAELKKVSASPTKKKKTTKNHGGQNYFKRAILPLAYWQIKSIAMQGNVSNVFGHYTIIYFRVIFFAIN